MKYIFSILLCAILQTGFSQIYKTVGISYTAGPPTYTPAKAGSWLALDTVTWKYYTYNGSTWLSDGYRIQAISGCSAPAYTPTKFQSLLVVNACTAGQGGPELYKYNGSAWECLNCVESLTLTAGSGITLSGTEPDITISNSAPDISISLTEGDGIDISGTYPDFTIASMQNGSEVFLSSANNNILSKTTKKLNSIRSGNQERIFSLHIGDSNTSKGAFNEGISDLLAAKYDSMPGGFFYPTGDIPSGYSATSSVGTSSTNNNTIVKMYWNFDQTSDSLRLTLSSGGSAVQFRDYNRARIYLYTQPGGGTVRVRILNGASVVYNQVLSTDSTSVGLRIVYTPTFSLSAWPTSTAYIQIKTETLGAGIGVDGFLLEHTTRSGLQAVKCGVNGYSTETWDGVIQGPVFKRFVKDIAPDFTTMSLGTNDVGFIGANNNITYYRTKISAFIDSIKSYTNTDFWLMSVGDTQNEADSVAYTTEMIDTCCLNIANEKGCAFTSLRKIFGTYRNIATNGYYSDLSHYSTVGKAIVAQRMYSVIMGDNYTEPVQKSTYNQIIRGNRPKIQNAAGTDKWDFNFGTGASHTVTVADTGIVKWNTNGFYPIQQLSTGVTYRGLLGIVTPEVGSFFEGKLNIPLNVSATVLRPCSGCGFEIGDATGPIQGGASTYSSNSVLYRFSRAGTGRYWQIEFDTSILSFYTSAGSSRPFALNASAPNNSLVVDATGNIGNGTGLPNYKYDTRIGTAYAPGAVFGASGSMSAFGGAVYYTNASASTTNWLYGFYASMSVPSNAAGIYIGNSSNSSASASARIEIVSTNSSAPVFIDFQGGGGGTARWTQGVANNVTGNPYRFTNAQGDLSGNTRVEIQSDGATGFGGSPVASAMLDVSSTTKGFLPPRMTTAQRDAISSPATGLTLYNTDATANDSSTGCIQTWNGSVWKNHW